MCHATHVENNEQLHGFWGKFRSPGLGHDIFNLLSHLTSPSLSFTENTNGGLWKINSPLLIQLTTGNAAIQPLKDTDFLAISLYCLPGRGRVAQGQIPEA